LFIISYLCEHAPSPQGSRVLPEIDVDDLVLPLVSACVAKDTETRSPFDMAVVVTRNTHFLILSQVSEGYVEFSFNLFQSLKGLGYTNVLFIAEDCKGYHKLSALIGNQHVVQPFQREHESLGAGDFASPVFGKIVTRRPQYIHYFLKRGLAVLWQDSDSVMIKDPYLFTMTPLDLILVDDDSHDAHFTSTNYCTCLMYFAPVLSNCQLLGDWNTLLKEKNATTNQTGFNIVLKKRNVLRNNAVVVMPRTLFPNGKDFDRFKKTSFWIHANYRMGVDTKRAYLEARGFWKPPL
jgi:hypothetical protein